MSSSPPLHCCKVHAAEMNDDDDGDGDATNDIKHWATVSRFILVRLCNYLSIPSCCEQNYTIRECVDRFLGQSMPSQIVGTELS